MKDELSKLAERVESLTGPDRGVDRAIWYALQDQMSGDPVHGPRFTADLDAAMSLVPEGWDFAVATERGCAIAGLIRRGNHKSATSEAATPALALTAAALRARAEVLS